MYAAKSQCLQFFVLVSQVEEYTKRRDEILDDIDDSQTRISVIESEMTETLLAEYNEISASVKSLNSTNTTKSLELCELQDQDTHLTARLHVLDNQIKTQKSEIDSGRKMLLEFDTAVEEKKHAIFLGCESLRLYQTGNHRAIIFDYCLGVYGQNLRYFLSQFS